MLRSSAGNTRRRPGSGRRFFSARKSSPRRGLLLLFALFMALAGCSRAAPEACYGDPDRLPTHRVTHVVDGDTVHFAGGDKVRLIGVNAPEMNHDGRPAEPLAREATEALREWVDDRTVLVQDGEDGRDRYGRRLAHLFDLDGNSIESMLLRRGLGFHVAVAPNVALVDCLQAAEREAAAAGRGVWGLPRYRAVRVSDLAAGQGGFARVRDRVTRVSFKSNGWWIQLGGKLGVRVDRSIQPLLPREQLRNLEGRQVEVRGWLVSRDGWWQMQLTHPTMLSEH